MARSNNEYGSSPWEVYKNRADYLTPLVPIPETGRGEQIPLSILERGYGGEVEAHEQTLAKGKTSTLEKE